MSCNCRYLRENLSSYGWSKIIEGLSNAPIRCVALGHLKQQHVSVVMRDELRNYPCPRRTMGEPISLSEQRRAFLQRLVALKALIQAAS